MHGLMNGLENPAHAALPQLVQNSVLTQLEAAGPAGQQHLRLKFGEQATSHQLPSDHPPAVGPRQLADDLLQLRTLHQPALTQVRQECPSIDEGRWHASRPISGAKGQPIPRHFIIRRLPIPNRSPAATDC